jgi:histidyl-tRNA synthetase
MKYTRATGTRDILPEEALLWEKVLSTLRQISYDFGYGEIVTPTFESLGLFIHSVGESTDIVTKEMYSFLDKGGREITLKPEGTSSIVRAYLENNFTVKPKPVKLFYIDRFYRYERPQKGRFREFHQYGAEVFGCANPSADAEIISLCTIMLKKLGFENLFVSLNSIGCSSCRPLFREKLIEYLKSYENELCEDCLKRIDKNPLRVLDCKNTNCTKVAIHAPIITDHLCEDCQIHFESVKNYLKELNISYKLNPKLVRGLDYYNRTVFEVVTEDLGSQGALLGGGRYDSLMKQMEGPDTPAVGFAMGLERIIMLLLEQGKAILEPKPPRVWIANFGGETLSEALKLATFLRDNNISVELDLDGKGIKKSLENVTKKNIPFMVIIGEDELKNNNLQLKDMECHSQVITTRTELLEILKK